MKVFVAGASGATGVANPVMIDASIRGHAAGFSTSTASRRPSTRSTRTVTSRRGSSRSFFLQRLTFRTGPAANPSDRRARSRASDASRSFGTRALEEIAMSETSLTRRDVLATAAAAGGVSLLPGRLAAAGDDGTIRPFRVSVSGGAARRPPRAHRCHPLAGAGDGHGPIARRAARDDAGTRAPLGGQITTGGRSRRS